MTPEQQRIAIAEAYGRVAETVMVSVWVCTKYDGSGEYQYQSQTLYARDGQYLRLENLPRYTTDLNACHEMEKGLTNEQLHSYVKVLRDIVERDELQGPGRSYICLATAAHRAEAFLRTIGKWKQD